MLYRYKGLSLRSALARFTRWRNYGTSAATVKQTQPSNVLEKCRSLQTGSQIGNFTVDKISSVTELNLVSVLLTHNPTGAQHLHIAREDKNNTFGVMFRTTPMDDTGVPHILEHTVLCGSDKFPVRDPFFKMLNRSLSTFMNAMTATDWTLYPFSTQNTKDFKNLMSVYLDACFHPLLNENDFRQEGWRLEHSDINDPNSPIIFKGVVFNEMKGVFSSQHSIFQEEVQKNLLPSHTYGVSSGGLPIAIPELSWEALREFHRTHYHPSNARFYTYGDQPLDDYLQFIEGAVLKDYQKLAFSTSVPLQPRWSEPRRVKVTCRHNDMLPDKDKQTTVAVSYALTDVKDVYESSVLSLICNLLVSGANAPFYQSLIESCIGSGYAPVSGYCNYTRDTTFGVGLEGIAESDVDKVLTIVDETFEKIILWTSELLIELPGAIVRFFREGLPKERIEALLSQIELSTKHQTSNFGLHLLLSLSTHWNHDADPADCLHVNDIVTRFRHDLESNPNLIQDYIKKYFIENQHKLVVEMTPEADYEVKLQQQEAEKLEKMIGSLSEDDKQHIYKKGLELADLQQREEDLSCLPTLRISDIEKEVPKTEVKNIVVDGVSVQLCEQPTNEVVYLHLLTDMSDLRSHLKPFVPLFCTLANKMGAGALDYKEQSQKITRYTGGLNLSHHLSTSPHDLNQVQQAIHLSSFCLQQNVSEMFSLWTDIFNSLRLDDMDRMTMLLKMAATDSVNAISDRGHVFAMSHSASGLSEINRQREVMAGVTQVSFLRSLAEDDKKEPILGYLRDIANHVFNKTSIKCSLNAEAQTLDTTTRHLQAFLSTLDGEPEGTPGYNPLEQSEIKSPVTKTHFTMDFSVNYTGVSVPTVEYTHPDHAVLRVMAKLLTSKFLHREIREKGGAYGGGSTASSPGHMSFYSYRDPNSLKTVDTIMSSADWLSRGSFTQQHVDEAILAVFQEVDAPVAPGSKGIAIFVSGLTHEMRQKHREALKSVTVDKIKSAADKYLRNSPARGVTLIGPDNEAIRSSDDWTISGREKCCQLPSLS